MVSLSTLWRMMRKEKKRLLRCSSPSIHQYDYDSYSHNFDDGYSTDPDNVSRSFSARFAVPFKNFEKSCEVMSDDNI